MDHCHILVKQKEKSNYQLLLTFWPFSKASKVTGHSYPMFSLLASNTSRSCRVFEKLLTWGIASAVPPSCEGCSVSWRAVWIWGGFWVGSVSGIACWVSPLGTVDASSFDLIDLIDTSEVPSAIETSWFWSPELGTFSRGWVSGSAISLGFVWIKAAKPSAAFARSSGSSSYGKNRGLSKKKPWIPWDTMTPFWFSERAFTGEAHYKSTIVSHDGWL